MLKGAGQGVMWFGSFTGYHKGSLKGSIRVLKRV